MEGDVVAVGLGSGSDTTITRDALTVLRSVDEIYCPRSRESDASHARSRINKVGPFEATSVEYPLAMQASGEKLQEDYVEAARGIEESVRAGRVVAAVTVGSPFLYSTLGPLLETLSGRISSDRIRTVAGINSIQVATQRLNRPLVQGDQRFGVVPVRAEDSLTPSLFETFSTVAFTKVNRGFEELINTLDQKEDRLDSSVLFERLGGEDEVVRVCSDLDSSYDPPYFSLVLSFEEAAPWD